MPAAYIFIFIFGLLIGSFLNALIDRLATGETMMKGRSHCDNCQHVLEPEDLIPVFSWLWLRGKCRYCKHPVSIQNPLVELVTASLFVYTLYRFGMPGEFDVSLFSVPLLATNTYWYSMLFLVLVVVASSIVIFVYDLYHQIILDSVLLFLLAVSILIHIVSFIFTGQFFGGVSGLNLVLSAIFSALPYFVIIVATNGKGMGGGDMKLAFVMGVLLGYPKIVLAQYIAFMIGGLVGVLLLIIGSKKMGQAIAFGPFLMLGTIAALYWGEALLQTFWFAFLAS